MYGVITQTNGDRQAILPVDCGILKNDQGNASIEKHAQPDMQRNRGRIPQALMFQKYRPTGIADTIGKRNRVHRDVPSWGNVQFLNRRNRVGHDGDGFLKVAAQAFAVRLSAAAAFFAGNRFATAVGIVTRHVGTTTFFIAATFFDAATGRRFRLPRIGFRFCKAA